MSEHQLPWPTKNPRAQSEWDFRPKMLPQDEVPWCHEYEFGRMLQSKPWRNGILQFREQSGGTTFEAFLAHAKVCESELGPLNWPRIFYALWPEWPEVPYLAVSLKERKKRLARWFTAPASPGPAESLKNVFGNHLYALACYKLGRPELLPPDLHDLPEIGDIIPDPMGETIAFHLGNHESDEEMHQRLQGRIDEYRKRTGIPNRESRGAASAVKQFRAELCALGFWRLVRSGMSRSGAIAYTINISGKPLFADHPSAWNRAFQIAPKCLRPRYEELTDKKRTCP